MHDISNYDVEDPFKACLGPIANEIRQHCAALLRSKAIQRRNSSLPNRFGRKDSRLGTWALYDWVAFNLGALQVAAKRV